MTFKHTRNMGFVGVSVKDGETFSGVPDTVSQRLFQNTLSDTMDLSYMGKQQPITSTSSSYTSFQVATASTNIFNTIDDYTMSTKNLWYIVGAASRHSNGEETPDWDTSVAVSNGTTQVATAKRIGQYASSVNNDSFTTICYYAYQTTEANQHFLTIGLNDTHAGGVAVVMYELDYTGTDLAYYNASVSATSGSISVTNAYPNRLWSDHPTATARTWSGTKLQSFWANGTSNAGPATPSNNNSVTWTSNFNVEHGTNEHAHFASGQYNLGSSSYTQTSFGGDTASSSQRNGVIVLTVGDV